MNADEQTFREIAVLQLDENSPEYDIAAVSDAVERLMGALGTEDVATPVAEAVHSGLLGPDQGATVIGVASWSGSENGASMQRTLEKWLHEANDEVRVRLALAQNVLPFRDQQAAVRALEHIRSLYPQYAKRCTELIQMREEFERRSDEEKARKGDL